MRRSRTHRAISPPRDLVEAVADKVEEAVRAVDFDGLRGRAGRYEGGYVEPDQAALDLFAQAVDPFLEDMKHKLKLGLEAEALEICKGIVLGCTAFAVTRGEDP